MTMEDIRNRIIKRCINEGLIKSPSDLSITDQRDFKKKSIESSKLFEDHYSNVSTLSDAQIIRIVRYFMGKAAETCIADDLYSKAENRICNITYLLSDVDKEYFGINIPSHYMFELSDLSMHYLVPIKEELKQMKRDDDFIKQLSISIIYWQIVAYANAHLRKSYKAHGHYDNTSIKTLDEIRITAFKGLQERLTLNGFKIEKMNYLLSNPWNVIGRYKDKDCAMLMRTNHGYFKAGVTIEELEKLVDFAKEHEDRNYSIGYMLVNIESANEQHNKDHIIITGDEMKFEITNFQLYHK